jgi:hypothetical protein
MREEKNIFSEKRREIIQRRVASKKRQCGEGLAIRKWLMGEIAQTSGSGSDVL